MDRRATLGVVPKQRRGLFCLAGNIVEYNCFFLFIFFCCMLFSPQFGGGGDLKSPHADSKRNNIHRGRGGVVDMTHTRTHVRA